MLYMVSRHSFLEKGKRSIRFRSRKSDSYKVHRAPPRCSLGRGNFLVVASSKAGCSRDIVFLS